MKAHIVKWLAAAGAVAVLASCATTSPVKNEVKSGAQIIDWQGAELGRAVPEWVYAVNDSDKAALLKLPEMEGKVSFSVTGTGKDRDLLKVWVDTNDASAELSKLIQENVTATAETGTRGNKDEDKDAARKMVQAITTVFSNTQFSGFIKERDFWTQVRHPDGEKEYRYYVLYSIDRENLARQIDIALGKISVENEKEQELLNDMGEQAKITAMSALGAVQAVN